MTETIAEIAASAGLADEYARAPGHFVVRCPVFKPGMWGHSFGFMRTGAREHLFAEAPMSEFPDVVVSACGRARAWTQAFFETPPPAADNPWKRCTFCERASR